MELLQSCIKPSIYSAFHWLRIKITVLPPHVTTCTYISNHFWWHQAITWTNVDSSSKTLQLTEIISQEVLINLIHNMCLQITLLKLEQNATEDNDLNSLEPAPHLWLSNLQKWQAFNSRDTSVTLYIILSWIICTIQIISPKITLFKIYSYQLPFIDTNYMLN